jgi:hypothetical protein
MEGVGIRDIVMSSSRSISPLMFNLVADMLSLLISREKEDDTIISLSILWIKNGHETVIMCR